MRSISYTHLSLPFLLNIIGDKQKKHHAYLFRVTVVWLETRRPVRQTYGAVLALSLLPRTRLVHTAHPSSLVNVDSKCQA